MIETRIEKKFAELKAAGKKAFIPFITAGDPDLGKTEELIHLLEKCGASVIELGVPFSDPMADGPVIQKSSERALKNGVHLPEILALVKRVRQKSQIPILFMGYFNPLYRYGLEKFARDAHDAGVDGVLIVDLPAEEAEPLRNALAGRPINVIYLLAPTSDKKRVSLVQKYGSGFVYYVSITGITGAKTMDPKDVQKSVAPIRKALKLPVAIGFGISKPEHVRALSPLGDGVVVGSALVDLIGKSAGNPNFSGIVAEYVQSLKAALA